MKLYRSLLIVLVFAQVLSACVAVHKEVADLLKPAATTAPTTPEWFV